MNIRALLFFLLAVVLFAYGAVSPPARKVGEARIHREEAEGGLGFGDEQVRVFRWGQDVEALGWSGDASFRYKPLFFAGFGLSMPGRDELEGVNLKGRVAMVLRRVPTQAPFDGLGAGDRDLLTRIQNLVRAGAVGVIVLEEGDRPAPLQGEEGQLPLAVPVLSMPVATASKVCADLQERVARLLKTGAPQSRDYVTAPWSFLNLHLKLNRSGALKGR